MVTSEQRSLILESFLKGALTVSSVSPEGVPEQKKIQAVHRAELPWEENFEVFVGGGSMTLTGGHRVFTSPSTKKETYQLTSGDVVLLQDGSLGEVRSVVKKSPERFMYDLTVEDWHNFSVKNTQVIVSNSPDRNYRLRPPQSEGTIGCYNSVFGFIWEDDEFAEYLEIALWKWNAHPPETEELRTLDMVCSQKPSWKSALLWGALVNAAQALAYNWVSEEISYSIGGVSLDLEKSSKYMDLKRNAEEQWDKLTEAKSRTYKVMRGLAQPRMGRGVRSAFGPNVGSGVLSPKSFT